MIRQITITRDDRQRLGSMLEWVREDNVERREYLQSLESELELARALDPMEIPPDLVTMDSTVEVRDLDSGEVENYTLVYPERADIAQNRISILAPVRTALLGRRVGDVVSVAVPSGRRRIRIEAIQYQPENASMEAATDTLRGP
ncbi:MAG: nucleoside diphosphate kinase regulator [Pirellulaceae bacterium]|nr:nucleoside diphosphate kinase regulator [Pirellulaceae bacterium]